MGFRATIADNLTQTNPRTITFFTLFFLILRPDNHARGLCLTAMARYHFLPLYEFSADVAYSHG